VTVATQPASNIASSRARATAATAGSVAVTTVPVPTATPGPATQQSAAAQKTTIIVTSHTTAAQAQNQLSQHFIQLFRQQHPDIGVDYVTAGGAQINQKVLIMLASNTPPDVLNMAYPGSGGVADLAVRGVLLKLDSRIAQDAAFNWQDFWPAARQANQYQGAQVAMSGGLGAALLFYNKDLFAAAGRPTPDEAVQNKQWTWDALVDNAQAMTKRSSPQTLDQAGLGSPEDWEVMTWVLILLHAYGADYMNADRTKVILNSDAGVQALQVLYRLGPQLRTMPLQGEAKSNGLITGNRVAQAIYWMAAAAWWRTASFDWDVAPTPAGPAGNPTYGNVGHLGIALASKQQDAAWTYATFMLSPAVDVENAVSYGQMVGRQSDLPAWRKSMGTQRPHNLALIEATARQLSLPPLTKDNPQQSQVDKLFSSEITSLLYEGKSPQEVARTITDQGNQLLSAT